MTTSAPLRIGTRRSALATAQARRVADALSAYGHEVELVGVTTYGDTSSAALSQLGGVGVFVSALRERLLAGDIDLAVHSLKDLPTGTAPGLDIAAIPPREDPFDVLLARDGLRLDSLAPGARVGTGSLRRAAQLRASYPQLEVTSIRGNVDSRIGKIASGEVDAVVLARAGLARLDRLDEAAQTLDAERMTPAPGQGALAVECREERDDIRAIAAQLDDPAVRAAVTAERAVLATLEAGCSAPVGAYAEPVGPPGTLRAEQATPQLNVRAVVASVDGQTTIRLSAQGPAEEAERVGSRLGADMLDRGAGALVGASATSEP